MVRFSKGFAKPMNDCIEMRRFRCVLDWMMLRMPETAALEDNPLYLRLAGKAFPAPRCRFFTPLQEALNHLSRSCKSELIELARSGHLTDYYLSMDTERIVDALAFARGLQRIEPRLLYYLIAGCILATIELILFEYPVIKWHHFFSYPIFVSCFALGLFDFFVVINCEAMIHSFDDLAVTLHVAASRRFLFQPLFSYLYQIRTVIQTVFRWSLPLSVTFAVGWILRNGMIHFWPSLDVPFEKLPPGMQVLFALYILGLICVFLVAYRQISKAALGAARAKAIISAKKNLPLILESYPPVTP